MVFRLAKLANNVASRGLTLEEMEARLLQLENMRRSGWTLYPTVIRSVPARSGTAGSAKINRFKINRRD